MGGLPDHADDLRGAAAGMRHAVESVDRGLDAIGRPAMTFTTRIRFTEPVDPRAVWGKVAALVNAPDGYRWTHRGANDDVIHAPNPSLWADPDQGADAWARLYYGHEGSLLIEDDDGVRCPPAYVEVALDTGIDEHGEYARLHHGYVRAITAWSSVPVVWRDDRHDAWCGGCGR